MGKAITVYCDKCGADITLEPSQSICLGRSKSYDLCLKCYDSIAEKIADVENEILGDDTQLPERCIDCPSFIDSPIAKIENDLAMTFGSCTKAMKNFSNVDPCNQTPSWCPLKGEVKGDRDVRS